ncbi:DUF3592 domain-containing protein [Streptomyces sp. NPDC047072]|uniref:DUF3592 domain-containing protein n=1 Tax=Streptomyces sp. NPDC047072 TaxID=3154809 RepID=UPI0033FE62E5
MSEALVLLALFTGFGLGFLVQGVRGAVRALRLTMRGVRVRGVVTERVVGDGRHGGLVVFTDHLGRSLILDPGPYATLCGLPPVGKEVDVVYLRKRPQSARLCSVRHLLAPSFGWFLASTLAFGTGVVVSP